MTTYFSGEKQPTDDLLILKFKELIINILSGHNNPALTSYFKSLTGSGKPSIQYVMEANFCYNLSLENFAHLCNRSLSSFKRDFNKHFGVSPGKWLQNKRLEYAAILLQNSELNISQIVLECGFEELSHFSRTFKNKYGVSPSNFRQKLSA
jgi:AraC-like DNA-binding protein